MSDNQQNDKYLERLAIVNKIKEYERLGGDYFFIDVEADPPTKTLLPEDVDYLKVKFSTKIKTAIAVFLGNRFNKTFKKKFNVKVEGAENFKKVDGGAIITSNHFSQFENICVYNAVLESKVNKRLNFVIREGNYNMPGSVGYMLKYYYTLPLSSNIHTMRNFNSAFTELLNRGQYILVYPEQSMWWNYRKPKPFKRGAFLYAVKNNVPVIPCFTTLTTVDGVDEFGFPNQNYTIHVMPPIYPNSKLTERENVEDMLEQNFSLVKAKYEEVYKIPLAYDGGNFIV
ncbi:MAG: lysophospholipid acyltransferase family protein [Clostridia bacterium]